MPIAATFVWENLAHCALLPSLEARPKPRDVESTAGDAACPACHREDFAPRLLPGLPKQTGMLLGTTFTGLAAQLVWLHPRERAPTLLLFPQGRAKTEKKKKSWEFWHDHAKGRQ